MRKKSKIPAFLLFILTVTSCAIGPVYSPELLYEDSGLKMKNKTVVVSNFYKAQTELSYLGDLNISRILESAKLYDMSFNMANSLKKEGINAQGMKDFKAADLKEGEVLLSGAIITRSIPFEENFPFPGMMIVVLIGNVLPSPAPYKSGIDLMYQYELVDASGKILQSVEKESRIYYKDYYVWGRLFNYKKYEEKITKKLETQIPELIKKDLFQE